MLSPPELLAELAVRDIDVSLGGGVLHVRGALDRLDPALRFTLQWHRRSVHAILAARAQGGGLVLCDGCDSWALVPASKGERTSHRPSCPQCPPVARDRPVGRQARNQARAGQTAVEVECCRRRVLVRSGAVADWRCDRCDGPAVPTGRQLVLEPGGRLTDNGKDRP
jgi:hypothetical protein